MKKFYTRLWLFLHGYCKHGTYTRPYRHNRCPRCYQQENDERAAKTAKARLKAAQING